jgi:hypothetical protein
VVPDRLAAAGWEVQVAHARKLRDVAPPACKTDEVERVVAELCRRDLVPALWSPSLDDRALRERLRLASLSPEEAGVNLAAITGQLERGGARSFCDFYHHLLHCIETERQPASSALSGRPAR